MSSNYNWWQFPGSNNAGLSGSPNYGSVIAQNTSYSPPDTGTTATNATVNKPSLLSTAASSSSSSDWKPSDYLAAAQLIYGAVQNKQATNRASKPPKFIEAPQTDQEKKLWDLFYAQQTNPATVNNRAIASGYAQDMLAHMHPEWTPPKTSTGETGYNGTGGMKWPTLPPFDWSGYTGKGGTSVAAPTGPQSGGGGAPGSDVNPREGLGGAGARAGVGDDTTTPAGGGGVGGPGPAGVGGGNGGVDMDMPTLQKYGPTAKQLIDKYGKYAVTAAGMIGGPEAGLLAKVVTWILGKVLPSGQKPNPNDPSTWPTDHYTDANTDAARAARDAALRTPPNGATGSLGDLFQPTDAANAQQGYDFWNNLMNAPGQDTPSTFSYHVNVGRKR